MIDGKGNDIVKLKNEAHPLIACGIKGRRANPLASGGVSPGGDR